MEHQYHYISEKDYDKESSFEDLQLGYFSKKAMSQRYPKGGFVVLGGIGCDAKEAIGSFLYEGKEVPYYELHHQRFAYGVKGYLSLGQNQYIAIEHKTLSRNLMLSMGGIIAIVALIYVVIMAIPESGIDRNAKDYTPPVGVNVETDPNHIALPGYEKIEMKANSDTAYVALWNPPNNPCYFKFNIRLAETQELLYESELIPPGKAVTEIKFSQAFKKGTYPIIIDVLTFSLEDKAVPLNGGSINSMIVAIE